MIDFESRETELETWKNGVDRFLSSREERSRTDRSGRGGRNRYRGEIQTSRDSCYPLLLGEEKKRKKNTRYLEDASYRGRDARRILDQLFDRGTRRGGGRCRETRTTENGGEERKDTSDARSARLDRTRERIKDTHTRIYIYTYRELPISKERAKGSPVCEV